MIRQLTTSEKVYATTILEAEGIIIELKNQFGEDVKKHAITKRTKTTKEDYIEYFIVEYTIEKDTVKNIVG